MKKQESLRIVLVPVGGDVTALKKRITRIAPSITEVAVCPSLELLREVTRFNDYDAVLLDWHPSEADTDAVAQAVKACPMVPVIVVSHQAESQASEQMLRLGAQDYLVKRETTGKQLVRAIHHAIERKRLDIRLKTTLGELGQANARLRSLALKDTLTGALNRRAFFVIANQVLARARRHGRTLALLYCDLDGFKQINDGFGHAVGDAVLRGFRERCARTLRRGDILARLGGDEFVILLDGARGETALETAKRIRAAFEQPLTVDPHTVRLRPSIGIARFPECDSLEAMIAAADEAMYRAKRGPGIASHCAAPETSTRS
ncbi:MAG TPA: diguanylate cyclase response regulator [Pseudomonadales bacterium]